MSIVLVGSSSGSITLQEPAVAGTTVLDLPATSGTVVVTGTTPTLNGITFPATQVPSADANTLDDYEEGTWTPTVTAGSGSITSYTSSGRYTKIGNTVTVMFYTSLTTVGTANGDLNFTGLPFTVGYGNGQIQPATTVRESNSTGNIYFAYVNGEGTNGSIQAITGGTIAWANNYKYSFVLTYRVA
jgi:hypothetical protein